MLDVSGVDRSAGSSYLGSQCSRQVEQHVEVFFRSHTVTAGYDDGCAFDIGFGFFHLAIDDFYHKVGVGNVFFRIQFNNFSFVSGIVNFFFHHAFANRRHLRTAFGVNDSRYDVASESGTNLIQQIFVCLIVLFVLVGTYFQCGAVGRESAVQRRGNPRTEVATDTGGSHQANLRFLFFE